MKELWARLRTFFAGLSLREQALLGGVGALAALLIGVVVVLVSIKTKRKPPEHWRSTTFLPCPLWTARTVSSASLRTTT